MAFKKALAYSFLLLRHRPRTSAELYSRLKRKNYSEFDIKRVISYLKDYGYLDDRKFAFDFVLERLQNGFGEKRIGFELNRFGVLSEDISAALDYARCKIDTEEVLKRVIEKFMLQKKDKPRVIRSLLRRGFTCERINKAFDENG